MVAIRSPRRQKLDERLRIHSSREARASRARRRCRARRFRLRRHRHFLHQLQLEQWQVLHWPCTLLGLHSLVHSLTAESPRTVELHGTPPSSPSSSDLQAARRAVWAACRPQRRRVRQRVVRRGAVRWGRAPGRAAYVRLRSSRARGENEREEVGRAAYVRLRPALSPACLRGDTWCVDASLWGVDESL